MGTATTAGDRPALTARQEQLFRWVVRFWATNLRPPSFREAGTALGINSLNGVVGHLRALSRKGYIEPIDGTARCLMPAGLREHLAPRVGPLVDRFLEDRLKGASR